MSISLCRALILAGFAGLVASPSEAAEWSASGFFSERVEAVGESGGEDPGNGFRSVTDLGLSIRARSPTTNLTLAPGVRGLLSSIGDQPSEILPRLNASLLNQATPRHSLNATLSLVPSYVDDAEFEEASEQSDRNVLQISASGRLGMTYLADPRNSLSAGVFARLREFAEETDSLSPSQSWGLDAGWSRSFTSTTTGSLTPSVTFFTSESDTGSDGETFSLVAGFTHRVNERLSLQGSLGPSLTRSSAPSQSDQTDLGGVGGLSLTYAAERTRYTLGFTQDVDQNNDGEIENRSALRGGVGYSINEVSQINLNGAATLQQAISGDSADRRSLSITPSYSYSLTEDWSLDLGYRFRLSDQDDLETSNTVFLQISRGLSFLP